GPGEVERVTRRVVIREAGPRLAAGAAGQRFWPLLVPVRHQRLAERQVEVDRAGQAANATRGVRPGLAGQRAPVAGRARSDLGQASLAEPAHRGAVQLDLVDGLVGA